MFFSHNTPAPACRTQSLAKLRAQQRGPPLLPPAVGEYSATLLNLLSHVFGGFQFQVRAGIIRDWKPAEIRRGEEREHERAAAESPGEEARALTVTH